MQRQAFEKIVETRIQVYFKNIITRSYLVIYASSDVNPLLLSVLLRMPRSDKYQDYKGFHLDELDGQARAIVSFIQKCLSDPTGQYFLDDDDYSTITFYFLTKLKDLMIATWYV